MPGATTPTSDDPTMTASEFSRAIDDAEINADALLAHLGCRTSVDVARRFASLLQARTAPGSAISGARYDAIRRKASAEARRRAD